ncbi:MAG: bile acid:sodium symporter family protein, partial [Bacteroidota bacterium]
FVSHLARGNTALSVTLTGFATVGSIFLTPLNFAFWGGLYEKASNLLMPIEIDPWHMLQTVVILLGIPMLLGVLFARRFPETTRRITRPIKIISIFIFAGFVVVAFSNNFSYFLQYIHLIFLIVLVHNGLALLAGFSIGTAFKLPRIDRRSVTIETGIQNSGLALVLIFNPNIFGGLGGMAFIAAWWGIWHIIAGMIIAGMWSQKPLQRRNKSLLWQGRRI